MANANVKAVKDAAPKVNPYFTEAGNSFIDIAHMLMELNKEGLLPEQMRPAIWQHAENSLDAMPLSISGMAATLAAAASGNFGIDDEQVAKTAWAIAEMASQLHGWQELANSFGKEVANV